MQRMQTRCAEILLLPYPTGQAQEAQERLWLCSDAARRYWTAHANARATCALSSLVAAPEFHTLVLPIGACICKSHPIISPAGLQLASGIAPSAKRLRTSVTASQAARAAAAGMPRMQSQIPSGSLQACSFQSLRTKAAVAVLVAQLLTPAQSRRTTIPDGAHAKRSAWMTTSLIMLAVRCPCMLL